MNGKETVELGLDLAHAAGADSAEVYYVERNNMSINVRAGKLENMVQSHDQGIGLRVIKDGRMGYSFTSLVNPDTVKEIAVSAVQSAAYSSEDDGAMLATQASYDYSFVQFDPDIKQTDFETKLDLALSIEACALNHDKRVARAESAAYEEDDARIVIGNSSGIHLDYRTNHCGGYVWVVAEDAGDIQTGSSMTYGTRLTDILPSKIGEEAAYEATRLLGARPITTQKIALILPPRAAVQFLGLIASTLSAETVQKGRSLFADRIGDTIADRALSIIDDGTLPNAINTAPADDEGSPSQRSVIIKDGVLQSFLYDCRTAAKEKRFSTGNGMRSSFKAMPEVAPSNMFFESGTMKPEDMLHCRNRCLYVCDLMGIHTANSVSGDFSLGLTGVLVEDGDFTTPVRQVVLAGNLRDLLTRVEAVGTDTRFFGGYGSPTLLVQPFTISGH